jgi:RNA polymerase sigma-70 factor (ECF subfamily)
MARVRAGETGLFEILMRRHNQRLYRVACGILGNPAEAEDVMQDAYVRAYAHLDQLANASFAAWLTRITERSPGANPPEEPLRGDRRHHRTQERRPAAPLVHGEDPEFQAVARSLQAVLEAAIGALPDTYRPVVMLRDVQGLSTAEAAECLELSEAAVKVRLHRGRAMLRREIAARSGEVLGRAFEFGAERCDRMVAGVGADCLSRVTSRPTSLAGRLTGRSPTRRW